MTHATTAGGKTARLSRERIVAAVVELLEAGGVDAVSTRSVGEALQVHPTALYRHFRDMDEVVREAADHILEGLADTTSVTTPDQAMDTVHLLCQRLRTALMAHPGAATVMASGPSRKRNEGLLTERMLELLTLAGLEDQEVALAYHALIEYTVGSAAIDVADLSRDPDEDSRHRSWRADYLAASPVDSPATVRVAPLLYPSQDTQFQYGLRLLTDGLRAKVAARSA
jgi:AcrR family transcriptional regulator